MAGDMIFVFVLITVTAVLMASNRVRFDLIAILVVLALMLSGVLTAAEALSGFGSTVVILVAGLLIVGEMLDRTGVAAAIGDWILKKGGSNESRLLIVIMASAGVLGSVMSSTAVVAVFIPIVLRIAADTKISASRMLLPMSYAALISGMLTLIATTPNIVVSEELKAAGFSGFGFFSFTAVGAAVLVVAIAYILVLGRKLLGSGDAESSAAKARPTVTQLWDMYRGDREHRVLQVNASSPLVGQTIEHSEIENRYQVRIIGLMGIEVGVDQMIETPSPESVLNADDLIVALGLPEDIDRMTSEMSFDVSTPQKQRRQRWFWTVGASTVMIHPESQLIGKSLAELDYRARYNLHAVGVRRNGKAVDDYRDLKLEAADCLLVIGPWSSIESLHSFKLDFVILELPDEQTRIVPAYRRRPVALGILTGMVLLTVFDIVPLVAAVMIAALAAVFFRCMTMEEGYRAIHWSSLVLVAGMLPLADALEKTGGTDLLVDALISGVGDAGPATMLTVLFFLTATIGLFLSNTASAVLVAPIAIAAAEEIGVSPYPFAIAVLIAASAAFVTPVSTPVVTLVVDPGRYSFMSFVKVGVPLLFLTYLVTLVLAPLLFPYGA